MGIDIHMIAEKQVNGVWTTVSVEGFDTRSEALFGFLGCSYNRLSVPEISQPRGFPRDVSQPDLLRKEQELSPMPFFALPDEWVSRVIWNTSWVFLEELERYNYTVILPHHYLDPMSLARVLQEEAEFFTLLTKWKAAGVQRIVYWFDN
jgi:hypothetical protein